MRVRLHPEARDELRAAALWYDERRAGLGDGLVVEVTATLDRIGEAPHAFPLWPGVTGGAAPIRRGVVRRFPYVELAPRLHPTLLMLSRLTVPMTGRSFSYHWSGPSTRPAVRQPFDQPFVAPRNPLEDARAAIWTEVLGLDAAMPAHHARSATQARAAAPCGRRR